MEVGRLQRRRVLQTVLALTVAVILVGLAAADTFDDFIAYALIIVAAVLPSAVWVATGARGIPIIPVLALGHIVYFAIPILRGSPAELGYDDAEALRAAATVALFLLIATVAAQIPLFIVKPRTSPRASAAESRELIQLTIGGLAVGAAYQAALLAGAFNWLGYYGGVARAIALTLVTAACYLLGVAQGRRELRGTVRVVAFAGLVANVVLTWMSLFLVGGIFFLLSTALGYAISTKRIPWRTALIAFVVVGILHAGKQEMRDKYWDERANFSDYYAVPMLPVLMYEWTVAGITALKSGEAGRDVSQRASLIWVLLHVQRVAPTPIPYLEGATYALLPKMLVPRFLDPDKIPSQAGMNLLNVQFGILSEEETQHTAVGWGPLAEGYANFGYIGVVIAALVIGLFGGTLTWWSAGAPVVSLPALFAVAAMLQMANMEADLAYLFTSLLQSFVGVVIYFAIFRFLARRGRGREGAESFGIPSSSRRG